MAGIYIHIPFCKQACHYCNFHFSTSLKHKDDLIEALICEIKLKKARWSTHQFDTIYFGGGTPSLLTVSDLDRIFNALYRDYDIHTNVECTLEANPDDISDEKITAWGGTPINRISLGIQSFYDADLVPMNRSHTGREAHASLDLLMSADFASISCDLIYGMTTLTDEGLRDNIDALTSHNVQHISAYALTVEKNTALDYFIRSGKALPLQDEKQARHFDILTEHLNQNGYDHYEISNFSLDGFHARHNTSYWQGIPYAGFGPSAHSLLNNTRQWNVSNNGKYIKAIGQGDVPAESEVLSDQDRFNELVMTGLRTKWGIAKSDLDSLPSRFTAHVSELIQPFIMNKQIIETESAYTLSKEARFLQMAWRRICLWWNCPKDNCSSCFINKIIHSNYCQIN